MWSEWEIECPVCGAVLFGEDELYGHSEVCPDCGSVLEICTEISWDTDVIVLEEHHNDSNETDLTSD